MYQKLYQRIDVMIKHAKLEIICVVTMLLSFAFIVISMVYWNIYVFGCSIFTFLICLITLLRSLAYLRSFPVEATPYHIPICSSGLQELMQLMGAMEISSDAFYLIGGYEGYSIRVLVHYAQSFNSAEITKKRKKANQMINKKHNISSNGSIYKIAKMFRINVVICESNSLELEKWVNQMPARLLTRNESIISAAIVLDQHLLLLPNFVSDVMLNDIRRYKMACEYLCKTLM